MMSLRPLTIPVFMIAALTALSLAAGPSVRRPGRKVDPCKLKPDPGPCYAAFPRYFYNPSTKECEQFIWGGCQGVVPFETLAACENATCDPCDQTPQSGPCYAHFIRYFFNKKTQSCDTFIWGGCSGRVPFENLQKCVHAYC